MTWTTIAEEKPATCKVEGKVVVPKDIASFDGRLLEIRLYRFDPRLADVSADLVQKVEFKNFAHTTGKATEKEFVIGADAKLEPSKGYYVTCFLLEGDKRTHIGSCEHDKRGIGSVLTKGQPNKVSIEVREVKK
jgi:hypothetical protein